MEGCLEGRLVLILPQEGQVKQRVYFLLLVRVLEKKPGVVNSGATEGPLQYLRVSGIPGETGGKVEMRNTPPVRGVLLGCNVYWRQGVGQESRAAQSSGVWKRQMLLRTPSYYRTEGSEPKVFCSVAKSHDRHNFGLSFLFLQGIA